MQKGITYKVVISTLSSMNVFTTHDVMRVKQLIAKYKRKGNYISSQVFLNGKKHFYDVRKY